MRPPLVVLACPMGYILFVETSPESRDGGIDYLFNRGRPRASPHADPHRSLDHVFLRGQNTTKKWTTSPFGYTDSLSQQSLFSCRWGRRARRGRFFRISRSSFRRRFSPRRLRNSSCFTVRLLLPRNASASLLCNSYSGLFEYGLIFI